MKAKINDGTDGVDFSAWAAHIPDMRGNFAGAAPRRLDIPQTAEEAEYDKFARMNLGSFM